MNLHLHILRHFVAKVMEKLADPGLTDGVDLHEEVSIFTPSNFQSSVVLKIQMTGMTMVIRVCK